MQENESEAKKSLSATTSPIKDTIRGSQEMIRKLMSKDRSGLSSSSSEKVYSVNSHKSSSKEGSRKLIDTVKEKFDNVTRGKRRSSKEPSENGNMVHSDHDIVQANDQSSNENAQAIAELDSVINSYNSASSGTKSSGNAGKLDFVEELKRKGKNFS